MSDRWTCWDFIYTIMGMANILKSGAFWITLIRELAMGIGPHISLDAWIMLALITRKFGLTYHHRFGSVPLEPVKVLDYGIPSKTRTGPEQESKENSQRGYPQIKLRRTHIRVYEYDVLILL